MHFYIQKTNSLRSNLQVSSGLLFITDIIKMEDTMELWSHSSDKVMQGCGKCSVRKCMLCNPEDLNPNTQNPIKSQVYWCASAISAPLWLYQRQKQENPQCQWTSQSRLHSSQQQNHFISNEVAGKNWYLRLTSDLIKHFEIHMPTFLLTSLHIQTHACMHTHYT